jgi:group II intron reverse transcriptase/maturase
MLTGMERISQLVEDYPERKLQTLMHLINKETLKEVHRKQEKGKASGIDQVTKTEYEKNLDENLDNLLQRMKSFSYRPQPVRRTYIEKEGKNGQRPLGIPAYEDRLVQGVLAEILNIIYEPKFYAFSYGFREGMNCHQAIKYLDDKLMGKTNWVVDADIEGFFNNVDHEWMMKFLEHEIADKNLLRYIKRFLKAGIMEAGEFTGTDQGVPQGGLCSPVMANVYLHYVIDMWFEIKVKKAVGGECSMVRYADDAVFCFQYEEDARNFYEALRERLA